jgi:hypothetical protein
MPLLEKIRQTDWWTKATNYNDRHYDFSSGIMLADHLNSVSIQLTKFFLLLKVLFYPGYLHSWTFLALTKKK